MELVHTLLLPGAWIGLFTLIFLEVVLGIDNLVFLSIMTDKLPKEQQAKGRFVGLSLAMLARIGLLFGISVLMQLTKPLFGFQTSWASGIISGQGIIIFLGGLFLLYKSVTEIHEKLEVPVKHTALNAKRTGFWSIILQIILLDVVFSFDSVLTAVGMISFKEFGYAGAMSIMVLAIVIAVVLMLFFSAPISRFVNGHPTIQMLALSFLILIGLMLLIEAAHLSRLSLWGHEVGEIPKGYIYFAIAFSLLVEFLNQKLRNRAKGSKRRRT